jgi:hypothetical protein
MFQITLKAARVNVGLNRKDASRFFNCHYETLANYEADSTKVPRTFFTKLEEVYGIPLQHIYFGKESEFYEKQQKELSLV